jgi:hypothetical protein
MRGGHLHLLNNGKLLRTQGKGLKENFYIITSLNSFVLKVWHHYSVQVAFPHCFLFRTANHKSYFFFGWGGGSVFLFGVNPSWDCTIVYGIALRVSSSPLLSKESSEVLGQDSNPGPELRHTPSELRNTPSELRHTPNELRHTPK